jgi:ABC-2 type transport system ATP-binding protein
MEAVFLQGISKSFGPVRALNDISASVGEGEIFGFIGPDGAGKSTLFRIIVTLLLPDQGECRVLGFDARTDFRRLRRMIGYMPGQFSLYQDLSVEENLKFFATAFGSDIKENYHLIADIYSQLEPFRKRPAGKLSGGMKQKLALCCSLIHKPSLLVLDEPTTGVDAISRREFWDMLHRLRDSGLSVLVSTPYMDEAGRCDRVALMHRGRVFSIDSPEGLRQAYPKTLMRVSGRHTFEVLDALRKFGPEVDAHAAGDSIHVACEPDSVSIESLFKYLQGLGHGDVRISQEQPDIEDCFISFVEGSKHE